MGTEQLEDAIRKLVAGFDTEGSPGGVLAVAHEGVIETCVPFGYANLEHSIKNSRDTVFYLASTSKQFVAATIAVLEADGVLSADDPIATWLPEVEQLGDLRVHHLVHHTSGIRDKYGLAIVGGLPEETVSTELGTLALLARQRGLGFPSGSRWMYSNSGYALLPTLIERCTGKGFVELTNDRVFGPLGMTGTRFRPDTSEIIAQRATGYARGADGYATSEYTYSALGPGGVISTVDSLARWANVFGTDLGEQLVQRRALNDGSPNAYAYGVMVEERGGATLVHHSGGVFGFSAEMLQVPSERLTVICLANSPAVAAPALARAVLDLLLPVEKPPVVAVPGPALPVEQVVGAYVDADDAVLLTVSAAPQGALASLSGTPIPLTLDNRGWTTAVGVTVEFDADGVALSGPALEQRFSRLRPGAPVAEDLCGRYVSEELATSVVISEGPGGLQIGWPEREPEVLLPVGEDVLAVQLTKPMALELVVRVLRADGAVSGLQISMSRAAGTVFAKA